MKSINNKLLAQVFLFILTFLIAAKFSIIGVDAHHDGIMLKPAIDVSSGMILFKESFTQYGALTTFIQAAAVALFGKYLVTIQVLTAFFYAMIAVLLWRLWSYFLEGPLCFLACLLWLALAPYYAMDFLPWSSVYALFFQLAATLVLIAYWKRENSSYLYFSGFLVGLTFLCRQPTGITLCAVFLMLFSYFAYVQVSEEPGCLSARSYASKVARLTLGRTGPFFLGLGSSLGVFAVWLLKNDAAHDWFLQNIKGPAAWARTANAGVEGAKGSTLSFIGSLFPHLFPENLSLLWSLLPVVCFYLICKVAFSERLPAMDLEKRAILIVSLVSLASWHQYFPITCERHVYWAATPMVGLPVYAVWQFVSKKNFQNKIALLSVVLVLVFGWDVSKRIYSGINKVYKQYFNITVPSVLSGLDLTPEDAAYFLDIGNQLKMLEAKYPDKNVITVGKDALYPTFSSRGQNFHPFYVNWKDWIKPIYPNYQLQLQEYILKEKPILFVPLDVSAPAKHRLILVGD